jgi:hypothetical protein
MGKKGGSSTTVQSYKPTEQEIRLQKAAADYSEAIAPNALWLNGVARGLLQDSLGTIQVDYNQLLNNANQQTAAAQQGVANLTQGILPSAYQQNMENAIRSGVNNTMGSTLSGLGARGILNSSVTNTALNDISKNAADTMAQQYQSNIDKLNGLYGQQASLAGQNITTSAAAQEAAQQPALNLWNASLGLNSGGTLGALNAMKGTGTTTSTTSQSGGGGVLGSLFNAGLGMATGSYGSLWCFVGETPIETDAGAKAICDVSVGDKILTYDHVRDRQCVEEVVEVMEPQDSEVYMVVCQDEKGNVRDVITTLTQPLMKADGTWRDVAMLRIGDDLKNVGKVKSVIFNGTRKVYDMKLTGKNTYYANGFVAKGATNEW